MGDRVYEFRAQGIGRDLDERPALRPPSWLLTAGELVRFPTEYAASLVLDTVTGPLADLNQGEGRPVLVLPGFGAADGATRRLRGHLGRRGWAVHGWGVGQNHGLTDAVLDGALARLDEVYAEHGRPVDLVGWSFGGLLARWLAHERPGQVRSVVTLGSPWRPEGERTRTTPLFERSRRTHGVAARAEQVLDQLRRPLPVPSTAIWSRTDGIVPWRGCAVDEDETSRNVSVPSSHLGMAANPFALTALTRALRHPPGGGAS